MPEARPLTVQPSDLAGLDGLGTDAVVVFAYSDAGPVGGLGDLIDWRLGSCINKAKCAGHFGAALGEQLLLPGPARLAHARVFVFGLGAQIALSQQAFTTCLTGALAAVQRAGCRRAAIAVPQQPSSAVQPLDFAASIIAQADAPFGHIIAKVLTLRVD